MLGMISHFADDFESYGFKVTCPPIVQTLSESELMALVPSHDGWILGDDPATQAVFSAGRSGQLKAVVKWGVGVDNVDFNAATMLGLPVTNTPQMFGAEVADIAVGYVIALARGTFAIDREVRRGFWPKPAGISLAGKKVAIVGYGDIGSNAARRLHALDMIVTVYDPMLDTSRVPSYVTVSEWPYLLGEADIVLLTCALTAANHHMLNELTLKMCKTGVRIVNVSRGALIDESALVPALRSGVVHSAALEVFEVEPLPHDSPLRQFQQCIFGSHNASNTVDAVVRTSRRAIALLATMLGAAREVQ